jgi:hypothetical protein
MHPSRLFLFFFAAVTVSAAQAQEVLWKAGLHNFFNNYEFGLNGPARSQTLAGTHLQPQLGLQWMGVHRIYAGADLMTEWGTGNILDYSNILAYYEYAGRSFHLWAGLFPRKEALDDYPRMFFNDSIRDYRPTLSGFYWQWSGKPGNSAAIWMDWTGRQSWKRRETFLMGWKGHFREGLFTADHFGYMFHFANPGDEADDPYPMHDNGLILTRVGIDLARLTGWERLEAHAGWSMAIERERGGTQGWQCPQGLLVEAAAEWKGLSLENSFYKGKGQELYYEQLGSRLYWGDPCYRASTYNRTDFSIHFLRTNAVDLRFTWTVHILDGGIYNQQAFYLAVDLDKPAVKKRTRPYHYLWENWK